MLQAAQIRPYGAAAIAQAAAVIADGHPVAIATETVYGLAADATNREAVARIYAAKGRPSFNPLIIHALDLNAAEQLGCFDHAARALAGTYWPGPLTLVVPARSENGVASLATAGLATIAVRVPAHRAIRALLEATGKPLAAPSANRSGHISPTRAEHVARSLGSAVDLIVDDGVCSLGIESTIVAALGGSLRLLRPGHVVLNLPVVQGSTLEAPGQLASHYAPTKPLRLNANDRRKDEWLIGFGPVHGDANLSPTSNLIEAAARLFDLLHAAEQAPAAKIAVAPVPANGIGQAVNDRLRRATA